MNQPISPSRLLSRFVAYRVALEAFRLVAVATRRWRGWAHLVDQARRAGHLTRNGEPGWIVLGRGFHDLLMMEMAWLAARAM